MPLLLVKIFYLANLMLVLHGYTQLTAQILQENLFRTIPNLKVPENYNDPIAVVHGKHIDYSLKLIFSPL